MTEDFSRDTATDFEGKRKDADQVRLGLEKELQELEDGLPTFVAEVGANTLYLLERVMRDSRLFREEQVRAVKQLAVQQDEVELVELRLAVWEQ